MILWLLGLLRDWLVRWITGTDDSWSWLDELVITDER